MLVGYRVHDMDQGLAAIEGAMPPGKQVALQLALALALAGQADAFHRSLPDPRSAPSASNTANLMLDEPPITVNRPRRHGSVVGVAITFRWVYQACLNY